MAIDEEDHWQLEIRDRDDGRIVTLVELLSPANKKAGPDREQYLNKRHQTLSGGANVVEIDLLRGGPRMDWDGLPAPDYCVVVAAGAGLPKVGVWPIWLRDPLPSIPIPLAGDDPPVRLDLQGPLHRVYDAVRYGRFLYRDVPTTRLTPADRAWADGLIAAAGAT